MIKIVCPSHGRANNFLTNIENMIVCVEEGKQADLYKQNKLQFDIIEHPKLKNLAQKRQWILEKFGDVFMVDDDIVKVESLYLEKNYTLSPKEISDLIQNSYEQAISLNVFLFGFNDSPNPKHFKPFKPFMAGRYINACAFGLRSGGRLFFDKRTTACESHWINLLNLYENRKCFIDKRFHFRQAAGSTFVLDGGQCGKRTLESEKQDTIFLRKMFGNRVLIKKSKLDAKKVHQYQRTINFDL